MSVILLEARFCNVRFVCHECVDDEQDYSLSRLIDMDDDPRCRYCDCHMALEYVMFNHQERINDGEV